MIISIDAETEFDNLTFILVLQKITKDKRNLLKHDRMFIKNYHQTCLAVKHKRPFH